MHAQENLPYKKRKENRQSQEVSFLSTSYTTIDLKEPPPASTDSSDDQLSDSSESSILLEPGSPSPPPPTLHPLLPISIKLEKQENEDNKDDSHQMSLGPADLVSPTERQHRDLQMLRSLDMLKQFQLKQFQAAHTVPAWAAQAQLVSRPIRPIPQIPSDYLANLIQPHLWPHLYSPHLPTFKVPQLPQLPPHPRPLSPPSPGPSPPASRRPATTSRRQTRDVEPCVQVQEPGRRQKDEQKALELGLTKEECKKLVPMSMEEFNEFTQKRRFDEDKLSILRDMRRRGKNKVAAQNCRKRKLETIEQLTTKVEEKQKSLDDGKNKRKILEMEKENLMEVVRLKVKEIESRGKRILCSICEELTDTCFTKDFCETTVCS